jgi:hypothetical protein
MTLLAMLQSPDASLRWHYPDQVQRVFLTREMRRSTLVQSGA